MQTTGCHQTVLTEFASTYVHPVTAYNDVHLVNEVLPATTEHVKCADCHNPHQVTALAAPLPPPSSSFPRQVSGLLSGMRGISTSGAQVNPVQYDYEVCYRCHSGAATAQNFVGPSGPYPLRPARIANSVDERDRFSVSSLSSHPVTVITNQPLTSYAVKSLIVPATGTIIYCSDCHTSHGSQYPHILKAKYDTFSEAYFVNNYNLCYLCHNETFIMDPSASGFPYHRSHLNPTLPGRKPVPCSGCHDPHGVVANYHLINFDTVLLPPAVDLPVQAQTYVSSGPGRGSCTVSCHSTGAPNKYTHSYP
jgi:predicted CXXCH cytochrome family protein